MVQDNQVLLEPRCRYLFQKQREIMIFGSLIPINSVVFLISPEVLPNDGLDCYSL